MWSWEKDDIEPEDWKESFRASGDCICEICGKPFYKHYKPAKQSCPTLIIACSGVWLKL